jgi:hypothetical protein
MSVAMTSGYPVQINFNSESSKRSRITVLLRPLLAIPAILVMYVHLIGFFITTLLSWLAIMFTGRYPGGLHRFGENTMRLFTCVMSYLLFLTDEYPPFSGTGSKAQSYPVQYAISYPGKSSRLTVFFRTLLAIPALIFAAVVIVVAEVLTLIAWVTIIITGRYPGGLRGYVERAVRCIQRLYGYMYFLVDSYPPFSLSA